MVFKTDNEQCLKKNHSLITFEVSFPTSVYLASHKSILVHAMLHPLVKMVTN